MAKLSKYIPFTWKIGGLYVGTVVIFGLGLAYLVPMIHTSQATEGLDLLTTLLLMKKELTRVGITCALAILALFLWLYSDLRRFMTQINKNFIDSIQQNKLLSNFEELHTRDIFELLYRNANILFSRFRTFSGLKSTRIFLETSSIQTIMNHVSEGIVLINFDQTVSHINHKAEELLGLVPDEIIGQVASRQISNSAILDAIDTAIEKEQKTLDIDIELNDHSHVCASLFPVKGALNEVIRVIMIIKPKPEPHTPDLQEPIEI